MTLDLVTVPCLADNFAYLLHDAATGETALVDAPEAAPILEALSGRGWRLSEILITHHHADHVQAVEEIRAATGARVLGAKADRHRLPPLDQELTDGERLTICGEICEVIDVPGHTISHVAFHLPQSGIVFTADSLMAAGCGRLFEGTAEQMLNSLRRLAALPPETLVASGHDYLDGNLRFALHLEPDNAEIKSRIERVGMMRREGRLPMPWTLAEERATNPFLRTATAPIRQAAGLPDSPELAVFATIRAMKDKF